MRPRFLILNFAFLLVVAFAPSVSAQLSGGNTGGSGISAAGGVPGKPKPKPTPTPTPAPHVDGETDWKNLSTAWSTAGNWTHVSGSEPPAPGDVAWFTTVMGTNPSLASTSPNIAGLYFSTTASSGYSFTRTTGTFTLTGFATSIGTEISNSTAVAIGANNTSGSNTITVPITLAPASGSTSTFFQAAGGTLNLSSSVTVISGSGILLNLTGGGTMSFGAVNTYDGGTKIAGPTVINAGTGAIFGTGTLELNSGKYESSSSTTRSIANVVSITGDFTFDSLSSGINEFTGLASTTGDRALTVNSVTTRFTNTFTLGGNLTTTGTGRLNLQGGLNLGGADRTITAGATGVGGNFIAGAIDSSASGNTLTLKGTNFSIGSGATPVTAGTNVVNFDVNATGTITFGSANTFLGSVTVEAGTASVTNDSGLGSSTAATAGLFMTPSAGTATATFTSSTPAIASLSSSGAGTSNVVLGSTSGSGTPTTLTVGGNNASTSFGGVISDNTPTKAPAIGSLIKTGSGTLTLTNANTYTGTTTVSGGTLKIDNDGSTTAGRIGSSGTITVNSTGTLLLSGSGSADRINNSAGITLAGGTLAKGSGVNEGSTSAVGMGALTLTASSTLSYTATAGVLTFASFSPSTFILSITNYIGTGSSGGTDQLIFNQDEASRLGSFDFGFGPGVNVAEAVLGGGFFEVYSTVPVPEPSTWIAGALAAAVIGYSLCVNRKRKRLLARA